MESTADAKRKLAEPPTLAAGVEERAEPAAKVQKVAACVSSSGGSDLVATDFAGAGDMTPELMLEKYPELVKIMAEEKSRVIPVDRIITQHPVLWQRFKADSPVWNWFKANLPQYTQDGPAAKPPSTTDNEKICSICLDENKPCLETHNCATCTSTAWSVCESCDQSLLSRACPFCKKDYKEHLFHVVRDIPSMPINFATITDKMERFMASLKLKFLAKMIAEGEHALVWVPALDRMYFSLLSVAAQSGCDQNGKKFLLFSLPMTADRIVDGDKFKFNNAVWDEIERELEREDAVEPTMTTENSQLALKYIFNKLGQAGAVIMLRITPAEWESTLKDLASGVAEAFEGEKATSTSAANTSTGTSN